MPKEVTRLMLDGLQVMKDFAIQTSQTLYKNGASYQEDVQNNLSNTLSSFEHETIKEDIKHQIGSLNQQVKDFENKKENDPEQTKQDIQNRIDAVTKTLSSLSTVSDAYK